MKYQHYKCFSFFVISAVAVYFIRCLHRNVDIPQLKDSPSCSRVIVGNIPSCQQDWIWNQHWPHYGSQINCVWGLRAFPMCPQENLLAPVVKPHSNSSQLIAWIKESATKFSTRIDLPFEFPETYIHFEHIYFRKTTSHHALANP